MDVDVANASGFSASPFDGDWNLSSDNQNGGLGAIEQFNANFDTNNGTIDPHLTMSNPSTPKNDYNNAYNGHINGLDQTLSPAPSSYDSFQPQFDNMTPYYQSVEPNPNPIYHPSPLRYNHRRSVSEPPGGPGMPPPPPPMILHRDNHCLGHPMQTKAVPLKSVPRANKQRPHPYSRKTREMHRPDVRRAQTQPVRAAPTSTPHLMPPHYMPPQAIMHEQHGVTSRVCTPTPDMVMSPPNIDPALTGVPSPMQTPRMRSDPNKTLLIPIAVDELRAMVFEAVQQAVAGSESRKEYVEVGTVGTEDTSEVKKVEDEGDGIAEIDP